MANEPNEIRRGDQVEWEEDYSADYPSSTWTLTYYFRGPSSLDKAAAASGSGFKLTLTPANTTGLTKGHYQFVGKVSKGTEVHTVTEGTIDVLADLAEEAAGFDSKSHVKKTLEKIEAAIESYATRPVDSISIAGKSIARPSLEVLLRLRGRYGWLLREEERTERVKKGLDAGGMVLTRFDNP